MPVADEQQPDDYRGDFRRAIQQALDGKIGFYADYDSGRQEEIGASCHQIATGC